MDTWISSTQRRRNRAIGPYDNVSGEETSEKVGCSIESAWVDAGAAFDERGHVEVWGGFKREWIGTRSVFHKIIFLLFLCFMVSSVDSLLFGCLPPKKLSFFFSREERKKLKLWFRYSFICQDELINRIVWYYSDIWTYILCSDILSIPTITIFVVSNCGKFKIVKSKNKHTNNAV